MKYQKLLATVCFIGIGFLAKAQSTIINDSTKAIHGSGTTFVLYESSIFKGNLEPTAIDTLLTKLSTIRAWYYDSTFHQDLGNVGTAAQPLIWRMPRELGSRMGRNAFDRYTPDPATLQYYDTRSPHTFLNYLQGGLGEQIFRSKHTRNVSPNWNVGVGLERIAADRQIGGLGGRLDGLVSHYGLMAFTQYASPNERYRIMGNYLQSGHEQIETGGIRPGPGETRSNFFDYRDEAIWLYQSATDENRKSLHATQWYKLLGSGLQLYHTLDASSQKIQFSDNQITYADPDGPEGPLKPKAVYYPNVLRDTAQTLDNASFQKLENTFGVMGSGKFFVYRAYAKRRDGTYDSRSRNRLRTRGVVQRDTIVFFDDLHRATIGENFIGGDAQFRLRNDIFVHTDAEFQIGGGDYRINAQARFKFLSVRQTRASYSPSLTQQALLSNHFQWFNSFDNITSTQTAANVEARIKNHWLVGELQFTNVGNYVYYQDSLAGDGAWGRPAQVNGSTNLVQASLRYRLNLGAFVFDNTAFYNLTGGRDVIRMPEVMVHSKIYAHGPMLKRAIVVQAGLEMHYNSAYYADGYMPVTQQFHVQNNFLVSQNPTFDVFLHSDIKNINLFLKARHLNTLLPGLSPGYFTTPYYTANPFSVIFGLEWNFYD